MVPTVSRLLENEDQASARVVLGYFILVIIHSFFDNNGRIARFLMFTAVCLP